jgi:hypothetical protein
MFIKSFQCHSLKLFLKILKHVASWVESVKIPASKMAAINRVQYHPPPPISFCEGPRIIQKLIDVVIQILELPLYIPPSLNTSAPFTCGTGMWSVTQYACWKTV